jgi:hypothetical protein
MQHAAVAVGLRQQGKHGKLWEVGLHHVAVQLKHQSFKRAVTCLFTVKAHNILTKILIKPCYGLEKPRQELIDRSALLPLLPLLPLFWLLSLRGRPP